MAFRAEGFNEDEDKDVSKTKTDITKAGVRKALPKRNEPHWRKEAGAYLGYRSLGGGEGTWVGRVFEHGRQHYQALGTHAEYRNAATALREWLARRAAGVLKDDDATVATACMTYVAHLRRERGDGPANDALGRLERRVLGREKAPRRPAIAAQTLAAIKLKDLRGHHLTAWRAAALSPDGDAALTRPQRASARRDLVVLKAALNFAYSEELIASTSAWDRLRGFGDIDAGNDAKPYLTPQQRRDLLAAVEDEGLRNLLEGMARLGARPIELQRAEVRDYCARTATLKLWSMKGRHATKRVREVHLQALPGAVELLKRLAKDKLPGARLWTRSNGEPWAYRDQDESVRDAAQRAGLPANTTSYCLRHSFITDAVASGAPIDTVARTVGTSPSLIAKTYGKSVQEHAVQAFARMVAL